MPEVSHRMRFIYPFRENKTKKSQESNYRKGGLFGRSNLPGKNNLHLLEKNSLAVKTKKLEKLNRAYKPPDPKIFLEMSLETKQALNAERYGQYLFAARHYAIAGRLAFATSNYDDDSYAGNAAFLHNKAMTAYILTIALGEWTDNVFEEVCLYASAFSEFTRKKIQPIPPTEIITYREPNPPNKGLEFIELDEIACKQFGYVCGDIAENEYEIAKDRIKQIQMGNRGLTDNEGSAGAVIANMLIFIEDRLKIRCNEPEAAMQFNLTEQLAKFAPEETELIKMAATRTTKEIEWTYTPYISARAYLLAAKIMKSGQEIAIALENAKIIDKEWSLNRQQEWLERAFELGETEANSYGGDRKNNALEWLYICAYELAVLELEKKEPNILVLDKYLYDVDNAVILLQCAKNNHRYDGFVPFDSKVIFFGHTRYDLVAKTIEHRG